MRFPQHKPDSIQATDYIANYFVLNLGFSGAKIENLKWLGGDIILLIFAKYVTLLVQKRKICVQYIDWQFLLSLNIFSFWLYKMLQIFQRLVE